MADEPQTTAQEGMAKEFPYESRNSPRKEVDEDCHEKLKLAPVHVIPSPATWYDFKSDGEKSDDDSNQNTASKNSQVEDDDITVGSDYSQDDDDVSFNSQDTESFQTDLFSDKKTAESRLVVSSTCNPKPLVAIETPKRKLVIRKTSLPRKTKPTSSKLQIKALKEVTTEVLPNAAQELITSTARRAYHYTCLTYSMSTWFQHRSYQSEINNKVGGYRRNYLQTHGIRDPETNEILWRESSTTGVKKAKNKKGEQLGWEDEWDKARLALPPFSSLPWIDRQLVTEWRTCDYLSTRAMKQQRELGDDGITFENLNRSKESLDDWSHDVDFEQARTLVPKPLSRPPWENAMSCYACRKPFGSSRLRHHCRLCGRSYCHLHSRWGHKLPHLGYSPEIPERVCAPCKQVLYGQNLAERIAWRMARCRDCLSGPDLVPYFDTGVDSIEDAAYRLTRAALHMARSIPLGAQAAVAVETLDVLRKHGLKGVYGLILRKEFMAAADLLCKVTGINKRAWPLSVHELSAAIFYALAQHRALRGIDPEREHRIHSFKRGGENESVTTLNEDELSTGKSSCLSSESLKKSEGAVEQHSNCYIIEELGVDPLGTDEGGDMIVWGKQTLQMSGTCISNRVIDETDDYDPVSDNDLVVMTMTEQELKGPRSSNAGCPQVQTGEKRSELKKGDSRTEGNVSSDALNKQTEESQKNPIELPFEPVCEPVSDAILSSLMFYAPLAMNFIYATSEVDMQLLAAQQGWRLVYAHLNQIDDGSWGGQVADKPAAALFVHMEQKIACFAVRGTATINDVVTDIRAMPVQFPDAEIDGYSPAVEGRNEIDEEGWTSILKGQGLALCGMAGAAYNLFRENIDALLLFARKGYRIRLTGHSLGGSVAALLGALVRRHFELKISSGDALGDVVWSCEFRQGGEEKKRTIPKNDMLRVYSYGSPACVDAKLSDYAQSYVTNCVLHDDIVPRLTPTSIRAFLKHLLTIRETWVKEHLTDDITAITERAKTAWAPKLRNGFTLMPSKKASMKVYKKLKAKGNSFQKKLKRQEKRRPNAPSAKILIHDEGRQLSDTRKMVEDELKKLEADRAEADDDKGRNSEESGANEDREALLYDGDCFYEAEESLIECSDEESEGDDVHNLSW